MPREIVVIFVHGINTTCQDYYQPMRDLLLKELPKADRDYVVFRAVFWADIVRGRQQEYALYARSQRGYRETSFRKLVIEGLGDAAAYQKTEWFGTAYDLIQERLKRAIKDASTGANDRRPLVIVGHSLGCHIVSSYSWDMHQRKPHVDGEPDFITDETWRDPPGSPLERLDTFAGFVTMGSNMPLFTFTFGPQHVYPITKTKKPERFKPAFPGAALDESVRAQARWINFYSGNDPLGFPLKPLNDSYDSEELLTDVHTYSEGMLRALLVRSIFRALLAKAAHSGYWTDRKVIRQTKDLLHKIINADELMERQKAPRRGWRLLRPT